VTALATDPAARPGGLLRERNFRLLWFGETTSSLGSSVTSVALPLVALAELHAGVLAVSLLSAAAWLPWLVVGLPAGAWIDRMRRRPVMLACDAVSIVLYASIPVAAWCGVLSIGQLLAVALLTGTAKVFFATAYRAYLPSVVAPDDLVEGNAKLQGSESAVQVAGPGIAGLLAQAFGAAAGMLLDAASFVVSALCLRSIRAAEACRRPQRRRLRHEIADGMRFVAHDRYLRAYVAFGGAANLALTGYQSILVVFLVRDVGLGPGMVGWLIACGSLGGVLGAAVAPRLARALGSARALLLCKVGAAPFGLLIPLTAEGPRLALFAVGTGTVVAGVVGGNVISAGFMQRYCPPGLFGRVSTSMQVVNYGTIPFGALAAGAIAGAFGVRAALWIMLALFACAGGILLASPFATLRDLPTRPGRSSDVAGTIRA
jgi:MFS family permease